MLNLVICVPATLTRTRDLYLRHLNILVSSYLFKLELWSKTVGVDRLLNYNHQKYVMNAPFNSAFVLRHSLALPWWLSQSKLSNCIIQWFSFFKKSYADLGGCYPHNTFLDLCNSSHPTQPHSKIANLVNNWFVWKSTKIKDASIQYRVVSA